MGKERLSLEVFLGGLVGGGIMAILIKTIFNQSPITGFFLGAVLSPLCFRPREVWQALKKAGGCLVANIRIIGLVGLLLFLALGLLGTFVVSTFGLIAVMDLAHQKWPWLSTQTVGSALAFFYASVLLIGWLLALATSYWRYDKRSPTGWLARRYLKCAQGHKSTCPTGCSRRDHFSDLTLPPVLETAWSNLRASVVRQHPGVKWLIAYMLALTWPIIAVAALVVLGVVGAVHSVAMVLDVVMNLIRLLIWLAAELSCLPRLAVMVGTLFGGLVALAWVGPASTAVLASMTVGGCVAYGLHRLCARIPSTAWSW